MSNNNADNSALKRRFDSDASAFDPNGKRARTSAQPNTRVVFVRGLPADCLESELLALCCPFAVVEKCVLVPLKCQAFVQLPDAAAAANLIAFYLTRDALIRGKKILFEHSSRDELTLRPPPTADALTRGPTYYQQQQQLPPQQQQQQQFAYQPPVHQQQQQQQQQRGPVTYYNEPPVAAATIPMQQQQQPQHQQDPHIRRGNPGLPNTILMVTVSKIEYDVTADVLQQVFQKFGTVVKIVTFWKSDEFKALVQLATIAQAQAAQAALDGRDIYTGCNQLGVVFSRHSELRVRYNNERSRDYTNPNLPTGSPDNSADTAVLGSGAGGDPYGYSSAYEPEPFAAAPQQQQQQTLASSSRDRPPSMHIDNQQQQQQQQQPRGRSEERSGSGSSRSGHRDFDGRRPPPPGRNSYGPRDAGRSGSGGGSSSGYDRDDAYRPDSRYHDARGPPPSRYGSSGNSGGRDSGRDGPDDRLRAFESVPMSMAGPLPSHSTGRALRTADSLSAVLICSNMDRTLVNPDRLFTFFGCYGDVERVKIMFRKQDTALIQFVDDVHATSALDHLDGVTVFGRKLRVDYSKHTTVSMPRGPNVDQFELDNTRDYSQSRLHRYRRRSTSEAVSPNPLLHISGIPLELQRSQTALVDLFAQFGFVKSFHFIQKSMKMALLEMSSLDEAVMALVSLDNLAYPDSSLRVSFSKAFQFVDSMPPPPGAVVGGDDGQDHRGPIGRDRSLRDRPRDRSRDRSRDRPSGSGGAGSGMVRYGGGRGAGGNDFRDRGFVRGGGDRDRSRDRNDRGDRGGRGGGRGGDSYRRPPPQRY